LLFLNSQNLIDFFRKLKSDINVLYRLTMATLAQDNHQNTQQTDADDEVAIEMDQVDGTTRPQQTRNSRANLNVERSRTPSRRSPNRANDVSIFDSIELFRCNF
jgi:hypothetical protein